MALGDGGAYATKEDLRFLWKFMSAEEEALAIELLPIVSAEIRERARQCGKDFDEMIAADENGDLKLIAKSVVCDVVRRYINDSRADGPSMTQVSNGAAGYTASATFLVPGGGVFLKKSELARLGLRRQKCGVIEIYGSID